MNPIRNLRRIPIELMLFCLLALAIVAPWIGRGWVVWLDYVVGPRSKAPRGVWGLGTEVPGSLLVSIVIAHLTHLIHGGSSWLPLALVFPVGGYGMARTINGSPVARMSAGILYTLNPIVFERGVVGQQLFLLGYALLPYLALSCSRALARRGFRRYVPAVFVFLASAMSIHFVWMGLILMACFALWFTPKQTGAIWLGAMVMCTALLSAYFVMPWLGQRPPISVTHTDLVAFRTIGARHFGLFGNLISLHGFWRGTGESSTYNLIARSFFLMAVLLVIVVGAVTGWKDRSSRRFIAPVISAGVIGWFLALGDQGPTGAIYRLAFNHLPGFAVMREAQKFLTLTALAYAVCFGYGAQWLITNFNGKKILASLTCMGLAFSLGANILFGFWGQIPAIKYPAYWEAANHKMGRGEGKILFLPWHQYMTFDFGVRVSGSPASSLFSRDTIAGDNVELPQIRTESRSRRSAYLAFLFSRGKTLQHFGSEIAPLGIEYIALAKTVDWRKYGWLSLQDDMSNIYETSGIVVYKNLAYENVASLGPTVTFADWGELVN